MAHVDIHAAKLTDLPLVRRLADRSIALDSGVCFTRAGEATPLFTSLLLPQRGTYTLAGRVGKQMVAAQIRVKADDHLAQLVYISPDGMPGTDDSAWLAMLDAVAVEAGKRGAHMLTAEVDEMSDLFVTMRRAGFTVYARQEIWRWAGDLQAMAARAATMSGELVQETDDDTLAIQLLYSNIVPRLVQPIAVPSSESIGMVYRRGERVMAYVAVSAARHGVYLMPFMHPDVLGEVGREAAAIIAATLLRFPRSEHVPVYVCVRRFQDWLSESLREIDFELCSQQALMVRHIAAGVRQAAAPKLAYNMRAVLPAAPVPSPSSGHVANTTFDTDSGDSPSVNGTSNYRRYSGTQAGSTA
jgi:hypothetical protein